MVRRTGMALAREAQASGTPVLMLPTNDDEIARLRAAGLPYVRKPFRVQVTDNRIQTWIDEKLIANVEIGGRKIGLRYGEIKLSAPLGFASYNTTGAIRKIEMKKLDRK